MTASTHNLNKDLTKIYTNILLPIKLEQNLETVFLVLLNYVDSKVCWELIKTFLSL